ncbi:hypothetical protein ACIGNX_30780 [Actinosynnema sp. NPDC053489]|uniref:hypothetical protein n=1 Tax=Actinosynnema sp. NPDC053489 TaxID=3363916 RepID=UPI0037CBEA95
MAGLESITARPLGSPLELLSELDECNRELSMLCDALTLQRIGSEVNAPRPVLDGPQHGFLTTTIWLSSWLGEAWGASLKFLVDSGSQVEVDVTEARRFVHVLGRLRTFFAHNLDIDVERDRETRDTCYKWFKEACGSQVPAASQWIHCVVELLRGAVQYLKLAIEVARAIELHPDANKLCTVWRNRLNRTEVAVDYLSSLQRAAGDLGLDKVDLTGVRNRYRRRWSQAFEVMSTDVDVNDATARFMEQALLAETSAVLPITAREVMEVLGLQPGEKVATALRLSQVVHSLNRDLDRTQLVAALKVVWKRLVVGQVEELGTLSVQTRSQGSE